MAKYCRYFSCRLRDDGLCGPCFRGVQKVESE